VAFFHSFDGEKNFFFHSIQIWNLPACILTLKLYLWLFHHNRTNLHSPHFSTLLKIM
jgi:hypothetical protein